MTTNSPPWFFLLTLLLLIFPAHAETDNTQTVSVYYFQEDNPVVPTGSLVLRSGIPGIFVAQNNQARFRMVRAGKTRQQLTAILAGLKDNDKVIQNPGALFDGQDIEVQQ